MPDLTLDAPRDEADAGALADLIEALWTPKLDPLFWRPARVGMDSAWTSHVPFAHWLVAAARPRVIVELGTHNGVSYSAFCEAVLREKLEARCFAVDTWKGDPHAGFYGEEVYDTLRRFHDTRYAGFSDLLRCTFDEALPYFADGSIDLLHIDGCHTYEQVRTDFENWAPKLSDRAVILFHDTNVRERGFGVWRLWAELTAQYPAFEFVHGHGLGVLAFGPAQCPEVSALVALSGGRANAVRERCALLGERWVAELRERSIQQEVGRRQATVDAAAAECARIGQVLRDTQAAASDVAAQAAAQAEQRAAAERALAEAERARGETEQTLATAIRERKEVEADRARLLREADAAREMRARAGQRSAQARAEAAETAAQARDAAAAAAAEIAAERARAAELEAERARLAAERQTLLPRAAERDAIVSSTLWRLMAPMRAIARGTPAPLRAGAKRGARLAWWTATLRLPRRLRERRVLAREARLIAESPLFDAAWYRARYPDVAASGTDPAWHYLRAGAREGRQPGPDFDAVRYLAENPDAAAAGINPLVHYLIHGIAEGRAFHAVDEASPALPAPAPSPAAAAEPAPEPAPASRGRRLLYVAGEPHTPGLHYRVLRPLAAALACGAEASWLPEEEAGPDALAGIDTLILWRTAWRMPWSDRTAILVARARELGVTVGFDVDDLMVEPDFARTGIIDGIRSQALDEEIVREHFAAIHQTMFNADFCIASTDELAWHMRRHYKITYVLPNTFDETTWQASRLAARRRAAATPDNLVRLGYASGSRTHQKDFAVAAAALARVLRARPDCRLVLFRNSKGMRLLDIDEFPEFAGLSERIEWREFVPLERLPDEMARFDVNLVPLEVGNPFCEAKSELKFFEAALADTCTIASPTGPFRRVIRNGENGMLAANEREWEEALLALVDDAGLRARLARAALNDALRGFGPRNCAEQVASLLDHIEGGRRASRAFALEVCRARTEGPRPIRLPPREVAFVADRLGTAAVTVIVPLHNYPQYIEEALDSVAAQTLPDLDLVVVDDASTDDSLAVAKRWAEANAGRFNRLMVLHHPHNAGLGPTRNTGFDAAETPFVLPLDADNRLLPGCVAACLATIRASGAAVAYPEIRQFGAGDCMMGEWPFHPMRLVGGPFLDAMALVDKSAWVAVGGYDDVRFGWEDYDFWCRLAEHGMGGAPVGEVLAEYRVHPDSMLRRQTDLANSKRLLIEDIERRHPWVTIAVGVRAAEMGGRWAGLSEPTVPAGG